MNHQTRSQIYYLFPNPQEQEHLLSTLLRFTRSSPRMTASSAISSISRDGNNLNPAKPCRPIFDDICTALELSSKRQTILKSHTLFPYYRAFDFSPVDSYTLMASGSFTSVNLIREWRWCPLCVESDFDCLGYNCLYIDHQIPGANICLRHNYGLISGCGRCGYKWLDIRYFYHYSCISSACPRCKKKLLPSDRALHPTVQWALETSRQILCGSLEVPPVRKLQNAYRRFIGLETSSSSRQDRVRIAEANRYVATKLDSQILDHFFSNGNPRQKFNELATLPLTRAAFSEAPKLPPIVHLLLIYALFGSVDKIPMDGETRNDLDVKQPYLSSGSRIRGNSI